MKILIVPFLMAASGALAVDTFRCKNDLVQIGDSKATVMTRCGEPMMKDSSCEVLSGQQPDAYGRQVTTDAYGRRVGAAPACETVEKWTYNPGLGDFYTTIRFERGNITSITYGDRVK